MSNYLPTALGFVAMLMASPALASDVSMPSAGSLAEGRQILSLFSSEIVGLPVPRLSIASMDDEESFRSKQESPSEWAAAYRWPDPPPQGSPPGAIGGFGAPLTTTGGPYVAPTSPSDNELLQGLKRRAEQLREQMRARGGP